MFKKFAELLVIALSLVAFSVFAVVFAFDYAGGCGETYQHADGSLHQGECLGRELFNRYLSEAFKK